MSDLTAADVIDTMLGRFTSGNSVPVERAHIKRQEWMVLMKLISDQHEALDAAIESFRLTGTLSDAVVAQACELVEPLEGRITGLE